MRIIQGSRFLTVFPGQPITIEADTINRWGDVERRTATKQRRARGFGSGGFIRRLAYGRFNYCPYGRRATDVADHKERRVATRQRRARWSMGGRLSDPARRITSVSGMGRRVNDVAEHKERRIDTRPYGFPWHRKSDERRDKATTHAKWGGRRVYDLPERRGPVSRLKNYYSSDDPRIRALERRKS